jgi:hypothetical protein
MNWKIMRNVIYALLILMLLTTSVNLSPVKAASIEMKSDQIKIKEVIQQYYTLRYEELQTLIPADYSGLVDEKNGVALDWRNVENNRFVVQQRIANTFGDDILKASFSLNYLSIEISGGAAVVRLIENNEMLYSSNPRNPSKMGDLQHKITLIREGNGWVIQNDQYIDDLTFVLNQLSISEIFQNIEKNHKTIMDSAGVEAEASPQATELDDVPENLERYSNYAAANYVNRYYNSAGNIPVTLPETPGWNSSWPMTYKVYSSDCTNFISQAIYQGTRYTNSDANTIYPDSAHYSDWWYYKFSSDEDGSSPWINVGDLYNFLLNNKFGEMGRGPAGESVGICDAGLKKGNPIFMKLGDSWMHAVMVATNTDNCNITVNAHSTNYYHKPISYYSPYTWFPVQISGYYK